MNNVDNTAAICCCFQLLCIISASTEMRPVHKTSALLRSCGSAVINLGDADVVRTLRLKQMGLLFDQTVEGESDNAEALAAQERAISSASEALWSTVLMPSLSCFDWAETAVACARNLVLCCGDDIIGVANWQLVAMGNTIPGLEFDQDLLATSSGRRTFLRDCFCVLSVRSPTEVLTAASRSKYNAKMHAKNRGETIPSGLLLPYCVLSGPTQLSFVNKRKSSAFKKEQPPPMFHRFRDSGFGIFSDIVREFSGRMEIHGAEYGLGSESINAVPQALPVPSSAAVLTSIR